MWISIMVYRAGKEMCYCSTDVIQQWMCKANMPHMCLNTEKSSGGLLHRQMGTYLRVLIYVKLFSPPTNKKEWLLKRMTVIWKKHAQQSHNMKESYINSDLFKGIVHSKMKILSSFTFNFFCWTQKKIVSRMWVNKQLVPNDLHSNS